MHVALVTLLLCGDSLVLSLLQSLQEQKSDKKQMKAKLRRLEEDNAKREKQIEELLDPTKVRSPHSYLFVL